MKYYVVAEMQVTDASWVADYVAHVTPLMERHGGRYLTRTSHAEVLEGERPRPKVLVITEWPSREAAMAFYDGEEYRPYRQNRRAGAINELLLVPGEDITGAANIPG
ncbi:MAG TPA: DUF1330 domain-containing protein [Longimicrobium sp.]|nr:DUF1330 domain-containing protein [Longimicrobium sp.]